MIPPSKGPRSVLRRFAGAMAPLALAACAGATLGSGVGDAFLDHPPYYAGAGPRSTDRTGDTGHIPIAYQRGAAQAPIFDPSVTDDMAALLADMNAYLDLLAVSKRLVEGGKVSAVTHAATTRPPDVQFGCVTRTGATDDDCALDGDTVLGREQQRMRLAVGRPSQEWTLWMDQVMTDQGVDRVLVITLEVGWYLVRQRGFLGHKELELGTSHVAELPWLTSLETPVAVLQITGALVGPEGKAVRIGAEGLLHRRTGMGISAFGAEALVSDEDVRRLRSARREDLPGEPLVWRVGLRTLVTRLLDLEAG
jgi:hypothetical protein